MDYSPERIDTHRHAPTWDSEKDFLIPYRFCKERLAAGERGAYEEIRQLRSLEFFNTVKSVNAGYYVTESGKRVDFGCDAPLIANTKFYYRELPPADRPELPEKTEIRVEDIDCLQCAISLIEDGYNPAVLNMASRRNPGGGVATGSAAQEETLFRRSNLFRSMYQFASYAGKYGLRKSKYQYPLDRNFGGIYTPGATVFREDESQGYRLMSQPVKMSFIAVAGINRPELTPDGTEIVESLIPAVKNKIRTILRIGLHNGHDSLVLGALGCGAFRNPPAHVARLFHEVLEEPEFQRRYRRIVFAILEDHNSHKGHNPNGNFLPFLREFR